MEALPALLIALMQLAFGSMHNPIPQNERAEDEEILRYRIRRLDVGEQNGWIFLREAMKSQPVATVTSKAAFSAALNGKPFEMLELRKVADQATSVRGIFKKVQEKPYWQSPWDADFNERWPASSKDLSAISQMARPIVAEALLKMRQDRTSDFLPELESLLRFTDNSMRCSISLEEFSIAMATHQMLNRLVIQWLNHSDHTPEDLKRLAVILENSPLSRAGIRESLRHTFANDLSMVLRVGSSVEELEKTTGKPSQSPLHRVWLRILLQLTFSRDNTHAFFNHLAADIVSGCDAPVDLSGHPAFRELRSYLVPEGLEWLKPNALGERFSISALKAYESTLVSVAAHMSGRDGTRTAVALKQWEKAHGGNLPESLTELIPEYLPHLPKDLVDGKFLRYDRARRLLYSIGSDMVELPSPVLENPMIYAEKGEMILRFP